MRQGAIDSPPKTPFILGFECAGEIEQVGEGVTNFKVRIIYVLDLFEWMGYEGITYKRMFLKQFDSS